jgi:hypothetical protein
MFCILYRAQSPIADWGIKKIEPRNAPEASRAEHFLCAFGKK